MPSRLAVVALLLAPAAHAQDAYTDTQGRTWRQVVGTTGQTWGQVAAICPTDGTPCTGSLAGWTWASQQDVLELFAEFAPDIIEQGAVGGPAYTLAGLGFTSIFQPTSSFYTIVGGFFYISGWSSTESDGIAIAPDASASYNPHDGGFSAVTAVAAGTASQYRGVWLFRAPPACEADINADGLLNFFDVSAFLALYNAQSPLADLTGDGELNFFDISAYLGLYNAGCP
jgi:hypothetical protein